MNQKNSIKNTYRPELDSIRALAIIAVMVNHFSKDLLPSGYLGVDIFFVISGYVITLSLTRIKRKNFFDFLMVFYAKRIKRLAPALIFFVILISLLYCLVDPNPISTLKTGSFSLLGLSNFYLAKISTDYFASSTQLNAFTHTWSLSVEGQFYVVFPILVWFSGYVGKNEKSSGNLFKIIFILSTFSLLFFIFLYPKNESIAYFSMPTRFWEIGAGCLLLIGFKKNNSFLKKLENISPYFVFLGIIGAMFLPQSYLILSTVLVVSLTSILILCLNKEKKAYQFFTNKRMLFIGMISYSLYLWHWGVLVISRWTIGVHWWTIPFQIIIIYFISVLSFQFIEKPIRYKYLNSSLKSLLSGIFIIGIIFSSLVLVIKKNYVRYLYLPKILGIYKEGENWSNYLDCYGQSLKKISDPYSYCLKHERNGINDKRFYLIGDSHSSHFYFTFEKTLEKTNYQLAHINTGNQKEFPRNFLNEKIKDSSLRLIDEVLKYSKSGDIVAISFHRGRLNRRRDLHIRQQNDLVLKNNKKLAYAKVKFSEFINILKKKEIKVLLIRDTPLLKTRDVDISTCVLQEKLTKWNQCDVKKSQDTITRSVQDNLYDYLENNFSNVYIWDPSEYMLSNEGTYSYNSGEGLRMMMDQHHITKEFSLKLVEKFERYMQNNLIN